MKNYEEKYEELEFPIKNLYPTMTDYQKEKVEGIFPELKENEGEKIRKEIFNFLYDGIWHDDIVEKVKQSQKYAVWLSWLEKKKEQKPAEWSEEDEKIFTTISNLLWDGFKANECKLTWYEIRSWLLQRVHQQPQSHWKPSNEQMEIIKMVLTDETMDDNVHSILESLYNDLEKLM